MLRHLPNEESSYGNSKTPVQQSGLCFNNALRQRTACALRVGLVKGSEHKNMQLDPQQCLLKDGPCRINIGKGG